MADRSRGFRQGRTTRPRRLTSWELGPGGTAPTPSTAAGQLFLGSTVSPTLDGLTLVRLRGTFDAYLNLATASNDGFAGAFGIGLTTTNATLIGATATPGPITDEAWDGWIFHKYFSLKSPQAHAAGAAPAGETLPGHVNIEVDSKAMRKVVVESSIFAMVELVEVGTAGVEFHFNSRMLVKLP